MRVIAQIEMMKGTQFKYEQKDGKLVIDRLLSIPVPENYGFIPDSEIQEDGDLADIFVVSDEPIQSGTTVTVEIAATLHCLDNGVRDDKHIAVFANQKMTYNQLNEIKHYLMNYKTGFEILNTEVIFELLN